MLTIETHQKKSTAKPKGAGRTTKGQKGRSLRSIVFTLMLAGSVIPLALYGVINYNQHREEIETNIHSDLVTSNDNNARAVGSWISANESALRAAAQASDLMGMDVATTKKFVTKVNQQLKSFYAVVVIDESGMQIVRSNEDKLVAVADREYFKRPMKGEVDSAFQTGISKTTGRAAFFVGAGIRNEERKSIGVLAAYADMGPITEKITGGRIGKTGFSYLVDDKGVILAHPDLKLIGTKVGEDLKKEQDPSNFGKVIVTLTADGVPVKMVTSEAGKSLKLVSQIATSESDEPLNAALISALKFIVGALLLSTVLAFMFSRTLSGKITRLAALTAAVSKARKENEINAIERQIDAVGGAIELKAMAMAVKRLTASIKLAMRTV